MSQVFVEYKVKPEARERFLSWARALAAAEKRVSVYEGTDQPNLFVEVWEGIGYEEYADLKRRRTGNSPKTEQGEGGDEALSHFVEGGKSKIHIWHFTKVI